MGLLSFWRSSSPDQRAVPVHRTVTTEAFTHLPQKGARLHGPWFLWGWPGLTPSPALRGGRAEGGPRSPLNVKLQGRWSIGGLQTTQRTALVASLGDLLVVMDIWLRSLSFHC